MSSWKKQKLGNVIYINKSSLKKDFPFKEIEYVDISSVGTGILEKISTISISDAPSRAKRLIHDGDTILATVRPNRRSFLYIKNPSQNRVVSTGFAVLSPRTIDSRFLYYVVSHQEFTDYLTKNAKGAAYPAVDEEIISRADIFFPDPSTQCKIGSILASYDDLIENNRKRIETLEEMTQLLFREWFVMFKFPGHGKVKLVNSGTEYNKIPEGWNVLKLSEVASFVRGCSYSSEEIDDCSGEYYIVNLKSFNRGGGFRFDGTKYYSGTINENQLLNAGDIVLAVTDMTNDRAIIARPARVPEIDGKVTLSADVVKINSDILPRSFMYQLLSSYRFTETTKQKANGANVLHLKPAAILEFVALIPDINSLKEFDTLCEPVIREVDKLLKQNDILTKSRDLLIPQLVTGRRKLK